MTANNEPLDLRGLHYIDPVGDLETFEVEVQNKDTGEVRQVMTISDYVGNAVNNVLVYMFREFRWRRATELGARAV